MNLRNFISLIFLILIFNNTFAKNHSAICQSIANKIDNLPRTTSELILASPDTNNAYHGTIILCEKHKNNWVDALNYKIPVNFGKKGLTSAREKTEGDLKTPTGLYNLTETFGIKPMLVKMDFKLITRDSKYIDDSESRYYNMFIEGETQAKSYETMLNPNYKKGIVIAYNKNPVIKNKGSAIFMHIWDSPSSPTKGCIAMHEKDLTKILKWLNKNANPMIYITEQSL